LKVKPNSVKTFGNVQVVAEEHVIENGKVFEKAESIFQRFTENYRKPCKRCSM
jgi:hypothetical protein